MSNKTKRPYSNRTQIQCDKCENIYTRKESFIKHYIYIHGEYINSSSKSPSSNNDEKSNITTYINNDHTYAADETQTSTLPRTFKCKLCNIKFRKKYMINPWRCKFCEKYIAKYKTKYKCKPSDTVFIAVNKYHPTSVAHEDGVRNTLEKNEITNPVVGNIVTNSAGNFDSHSEITFNTNDYEQNEIKIEEEEVDVVENDPENRIQNHDTNYESNSDISDDNNDDDDYEARWQKYLKNSTFYEPTSMKIEPGEVVDKDQEDQEIEPGEVVDGDPMIVEEDLLNNISETENWQQRSKSSRIQIDDPIIIQPKFLPNYEDQVIKAKRNVGADNSGIDHNPQIIIHKLDKIQKITSKREEEDDSEDHRINDSVENNGNKSFKCEHCDKMFTANRNLKRHIYIVHEGHKDFQCAVCYQFFGFKQILERHMKKMHNIDNYVGSDSNIMNFEIVQTQLDELRTHLKPDSFTKSELQSLSNSSKMHELRTYLARNKLSQGQQNLEEQNFDELDELRTHLKPDSFTKSELQSLSNSSKMHELRTYLARNQLGQGQQNLEKQNFDKLFQSQQVHGTTSNHYEPEPTRPLPKFLSLNPRTGFDPATIDDTIRKIQVDNSQILQKENLPIIGKEVQITKNNSRIQIENARNIQVETPNIKSKTKTKVKLLLNGNSDNVNWISISKPANSVTLRDIKLVLQSQPKRYSNETMYVYSVKTTDEDGDIGFEDIDEDNTILPLFGDKIVLQCWTQ